MTDRSINRHVLTEWYVDARERYEVGLTLTEKDLDYLNDTFDLVEETTLDDMTAQEVRDMIDSDVKVKGWPTPARLVAVHGDEGAVLGQGTFTPWPDVHLRPLSDLTLVRNSQPKTLHTFDQYAQAPVGTVVAEDGDDPLTKSDTPAVWDSNENERAANHQPHTNTTLVGVTRRVLRWGRGN